MKETRGFHGSQLIPFPNRTRDGVYSYQDRTFQLPLNETARHNCLHGLAYNLPWKMVEKKATDRYASVTFSFCFLKDKPDASAPSVGTLCDPGYPFPVLITKTFFLDDSHGFRCYTTSSIDSSSFSSSSLTHSAPFGDGWHPYFQLTSLENDKKMRSIDHCTLQFSINKCGDEGKSGDATSGEFSVLEVDQQMIPSGALVSLSKELGADRLNKVDLKGRSLDTGFVCTSAVPPSSLGSQRLITLKLECRFENEPEQVSIVLWQDAQVFPFSQVYTPPHRNSIAIEPMSCCTNAFNHLHDNTSSSFYSGAKILSNQAESGDFSGYYGVFIV